MSDNRMNSIMGAVLASVLGVMGLGVAADAVFAPDHVEKAGFAPAVTAAASSGAPAVEAAPDFGVLFADPAGLQALIARGEQVHSQCTSCHTFDAGGANGIGPNLHDVFGRQAAAHAGFAYSEGMSAHSVTWDYGALNEFLTNPGRVVRGTKMAFAGIRRTEDRVALIAFLRSISPNNVPLPAPLPAVAAPEAAAPADAAAPAGAEAAPAAPAAAAH